LGCIIDDSPGLSNRDKIGCASVLEPENFCLLSLPFLPQDHPFKVPEAHLGTFGKPKLSLPESRSYGNKVNLPQNRHTPIKSGRLPNGQLLVW
jgi:hypothetical protein